ncbi:MAG TPA: M23 family metallopeptidase [Myxococcota bacterium]|nr:M23 family metallopeptidase [Myxococcota bacterium]
MTLRGWLGILFGALMVGVAAFVWIRWERTAPRVEGPASVLIGQRGGAHFEVSDAGSGLREIRVSVQQGDTEVVVLERSFPGSLAAGALAPESRESVEFEIEPKALGLAHGAANLTLVARDWSWSHGFRGNETRVAVALDIDLEPPRIQIASGLTYVKRGGSGAVRYSLNEPANLDGVTVGDRFYFGFPLPGADASSNQRFALFAVATDAPADPRINVVALDRAGNETRAGWPVVFQERALPEASITLPQRFLETKVRELAERAEIDATDLVRAFDEINTRVRAANETSIRQIASKPSDSKLWVGAFSQLRNSEVTSKFAEQRSYFVDGQKISEATHFGYDLASTAGASIEASNAGLVVFADDLGIYGNCVIIDHGLGLFSLYAHLSSLEVAPGDRVERNARLGLSGATGLAGGDHLHFAMILGGSYVEPLEWWDAEWVRTHVDAQLAAAPP